jgi:hypothetical protein
MRRERQSGVQVCPNPAPCITHENAVCFQTAFFSPDFTFRYSARRRRLSSPSAGRPSANSASVPGSGMTGDGNIKGASKKP